MSNQNLFEIKLLGKRISVRYFTETDVERVEACGIARFQPGREIILNPLQAENDLADTFLHESLHHIDRDLAIGLSDENIHRIVAGLCSLLMDNQPNIIFGINLPRPEPKGAQKKKKKK